MMRREPRCEASGGKRRFSADGAEASREQQQQIMVFSYRFHTTNHFMETILWKICFFTPIKSRNRIPIYGCSLGAGESGSAGEVRASAAKL